MNFKKQLKDGFLTNNPVLVQLLGMCSTMAITTTLFNGIGMGVSVTIILICSNIAIYTIQLAEGAAEFDTHAYVKQAYKETPQFAEKLKFYQDKYLTKIDEVEAME